MASGKRDSAEPLTGGNGAPDAALVLSRAALVFRNNGLEFLSERPLALWSEVEVDLHPPGLPEPVRGNGVVVDCSGSRATGYVIALLLLDLPAAARRHWERLTRSARAVAG